MAGGRVGVGAGLRRFLSGYAAMKSRQQDFVLGIVVIAFLGLFLGTIVFIYPRLRGATRPITVHFRHEDGVAPLKPGSLVMLSGALQVGKVTQVTRELVRAAPDAPGRLLIVVEAEIEADLKLYEHCQITTDQPPVGGGGTLVILNVGRPPELAPEPIQGLPPQGFAAAINTLSRRMDGLLDKVERLIDVDVEGSLADKISQSLTDINTMTQRLKTQLDPDEQAALMKKIHDVIGNISDTTAELRRQMVVEDDAALLAKVHVVLDQLESGLVEANAMLAENRPAVRNAVASVESMTRQMDEELLAALKAEFDRDDPTSLLGKIHVGLDQVNVSLDNVVTLTDTARKLVVLNRPALQRTIDNLKDLSDQLRRGVTEIVLSPWRLWRPPAGEVKRLDVFEAARRFAEAATMLDDAAARLEAVQAAGPPEGDLVSSPEEIREIQAALRAAFERFQAAEEYLWEKIK
jgi:ABC-type transporter Mla subunit MlaD